MINGSKRHPFEDSPWLLIAIWCLPMFAYLLTPGVYFWIFPIQHSWELSPDQVEELKRNDPSWIYAVGCQVVLTLILLAIGFRSYLANFKFQIHPLSFFFGLLGCVIWVGLCFLQLEQQAVEILTGRADLLGARPGINPWEVFPNDGTRWSYLVIRFVGMSLAIPIAEEIFLRGFLLRVIEAGQWEKVTMKDLPWLSVLWAGVYGVSSHPAEALAAFVWFAGVSIWIKRTGNFWDGVVVHAVTNFSLGIYICFYGQWHLW